VKRRGFLASLAAYAADTRSAWNVRDHIPLGEFTVQSHRGAGNLMAENSAAAFELAWRLGTVPEADLRTTRDGVVVAFHDNNFERVVAGASPELRKKGIKDLSWEETARLDIGSGQHVPRLADILTMLAADSRRRMYIDIKNVDLEQLAREARTVARRLILASTDYSVIRRWKALAPESSTLHWMGGPEEQLGKRFAALRQTGFADITQLQIHVRPKGEGITPSPGFLAEAGRELRERGILFQAFAYDAARPSDFWRLLDLGVASFATDSPDLAMRAIREYYGKRR